MYFQQEKFLMAKWLLKTGLWFQPAKFHAVETTEILPLPAEFLLCVLIRQSG
jgi:hypothetical protein